MLRPPLAVAVLTLSLVFCGVTLFAQTTPTETTPAQTAPAQTAPAQTAPAQTAPTQTDATQAAPTQTAPAPAATADTVPAQTTPAATTPAPAATAPATPPQSAPAAATPPAAEPQLATRDASAQRASANAASFDATSGTIAIADIKGKHGSLGSLAVCSLSGGCTKKLEPKFTGYATGAALAKNGDCWLTTENRAFTGAGMTYWRGCAGTGKLVTGFKNVSYGSLSIDKRGNLVSIDFTGGRTGQLWVYSGCNPACTLIGGPFPLAGQPFFGALNAKGNTFGTIESEFPYGGTVDIYKYTPIKVTYEYSFDSGFAPVSMPEGFAYSPALNQ